MMIMMFEIWPFLSSAVFGISLYFLIKVVQLTHSSIYILFLDHYVIY